MRAFVTCVFALFLCAPGTAAAHTAPCALTTGIYSGTADLPFGHTDVTLNLYCDGAGDPRSKLYSSIGDFDVLTTEADFEHVTIGFGSRGNPATIKLTVKGDTLSGTVDLTGPKGTITLKRTGDTTGEDALKPRLDLTLAQWQSDLTYFAAELPRRHANAFANLPKPQFDAMVADLSARMPRLNDDERLMGLEKIVNAIGDGHTIIVFPQPRYPLGIEIGKFGDDFRVTAVAPGREQALGARIVKIGNTPIAQAYATALDYTPKTELMELRRVRALTYLTRGLFLHGAGITSTHDHALLTLQSDDGQVFETDIAWSPAAEQHPTSNAPKPLARTRADEPFWCDYLEDSAAVFCAFYSYDNLDKRAKEMFALLADKKPKKLIIDMRDNGGGDNTVGDAELVKPLKASAYNAKGRLYILIGAETFSAAMNNAAQFQDETNAILVGETIGETPNSYQEPRQFRLPNSHLVVRASTLYYTFRKTGENAVRPNKEILPSWDDVRTGRDPVLDWVLNQP